MGDGGFAVLDRKRRPPRWYAPCAVYADEEEMNGMIASLKAWEITDGNAEQLFRDRGAVLLSDTVAAMRYAESVGLLPASPRSAGRTP